MLLVLVKIRHIYCIPVYIISEGGVVSTVLIMLLYLYDGMMVLVYLGVSVVKHWVEGLGFVDICFGECEV